MAKHFVLLHGAYLGMAQGLGKYDLIEIEGGHETLFTRPADVARGLLQAVDRTN
jgi:hypothetical protein